MLDKSLYDNGGFIGVNRPFASSPLGGISLVSSAQTNTWTTAGLSAQTITFTSFTPLENDIILAMVCSSFGSDFDLDVDDGTTSYTEVADLYSNDSEDTNLGVFWKRMGATPDTGLNIAQTNGFGGSGALIIFCLRGVITSGDIMDVTATTNTGINSVSADPPSITPVTSGSLIVAVGGGAHGRGAETFSSSDLSNFISVGAASSRDVTIGAGTYAWTSGAFDPAAFTLSKPDSISYSNASVTMAIKAQPSGSITGTSGVYNLKAFFEDKLG